MTEITLGNDLLIIIPACLVLGFILIKAKEPIIIGYLLAGIVTGGSVLNVVKDTSVIEVLAEIGIALSLFHIGVEFSTKEFERVKNLAVFGAVAQIVGSSLLMLFIFTRFLDFYPAMFLSLVFSLSSTAAVIKLIAEKEDPDTKSSLVATGWLIVQDLAVIPISILLMSTGGVSATPALDFVLAVLKAGVILAVSLFVLRRIVRWFFKKIAEVNSRELLLIASIAFSLGMAFVTQSLGISFVLGAFLAGLMLSDSTFYHQIYVDVRSIRDIFTMLFFFSIGALLDLNFVWNNFGLVLGVVVLVIIVKLFVTFLAAKAFKAHSKTAIDLAFALFQIGEFSFVLGKVAVDQEILSTDTYSLILACAIITILITPTIIFSGNSVYDTLREFTRKNTRFIYEKLFLEGLDIDRDVPGVQGHVVICGYGRVGQEIGKALRDSKVQIVVIDNDKDTIERLTKQRIRAIFGDATDVEILEKADVERSKAVIVALPESMDVSMTVQSVRRLNSDVTLIARSHTKKLSKKLKEVGVDLVVEPEYESAKRIVSEILPEMGKGYKQRVRVMERRHKM